MADRPEDRRLDTRGELKRFGFADLVVDVGERTIVRGRDRVRLERQPFELLVLLLERPGQLVTRAEIEERIWPGGVAIERDTRINTCVRKIREALRDSPRSPRFLETVAGEGYRFVAAVEELSRGAGEQSPVVADSINRGDVAASPPTVPPVLSHVVAIQDKDSPRENRAEVDGEERHADSSPRRLLGAGLFATALAATAVALTTQAVGVAAILYGAFLYLALLGSDDLDHHPTTRGGIAVVLVAAMAYVPSAWTLEPLSREIINFDALRPAPVYPFVTGLQYLPLFVLVICAWAVLPDGLVSAGSSGRVWFLAGAFLFLSATIAAVAAYTGQVEIWRSGLPRGRMLGGYYATIAVANILYGWIGYRMLARSPARSRSVLGAAALIYLVVLVCGVGVGTEQNRLNRYHLSTRRPQEYRAANPDAVALFLSGSHAHRADIASDLRHLLQDPEFAHAVRNAVFYRADLDEPFQIGRRAVTFGYATADRNGGRVFRRIRFPQDVALAIGFRPTP